MEIRFKSHFSKNVPNVMPQSDHIQCFFARTFERIRHVIFVITSTNNSQLIKMLLTTVNSGLF